MSNLATLHLLAAVSGVDRGDGGFPFPILAAVVIVPAVFAGIVALTPRSRPDLARLVGGAGALVTAGLAIAMAVRFRAGVPGYQFYVNASWIPDLGIGWRLGVDGISVFLVAVTSVLMPVAMLTPRVGRDPKAYMGWMLLLETACLGAFVSLDLFLFFVFFELTLPPMYFLIGRWGAEDAGTAPTRAAMKFFIYTFVGSAAMLVAILGLVFVESRSTGHVTFDLLYLAAHNHVSSGVGAVLFLGFAAAFAVKVPVFPLHTWLPDAQVEAGVGGSMVLAGVMFQLGTYGLVRYCIELFPRASVDLAPLMLTLGAVSIVYGFLVAVVQTDLKRLIAYTLVADLGVVVVGLFGFTSQGIAGGVFQTVNHGVSMAAIFLLIGVVVDRFGTRHLPRMGGLQTRAPVLAAVFLLVLLSAIGVPGLNGFVGEFLLLLGTFVTHRWWAVVATTGVILAALVFLWAYQQVFHGPPAMLAPEEVRPQRGDIALRDLVGVTPLLILIVVLGVYPRPFLDRINPSADRVLAHVTSVAHNPPPPTVAANGGNP